jgi:hypothetical protein
MRPPRVDRRAPGRAAQRRPAPTAPRPRRRASYTLVNATIHPASGPDIASGHVVVRDGGSSRSGPGPRRAARAPRRLEGTHVYPSLLPPLTVLGLAEISRGRATIDTGEIGEINPRRARRCAMNYDSELPARRALRGVLIAGVTRSAR